MSARISHGLHRHFAEVTGFMSSDLATCLLGANPVLEQGVIDTGHPA